MVDRLSVERRSWLMSRVKAKHTRPELTVRSAAHALGLRFRLYRKDLAGTPDLVFPRHRTALFVHGCFWHRHAGCRLASTPGTRVDFWQAKFAANVARDEAARRTLAAGDWRVITIWECETRDSERLRARLSEIRGTSGLNP